MDNKEIDLIKRSKNGDVEAFEALIRDYKKLAYNIAYRVLKNKEDAEDASQDALVKVFKNISKFNMDSTFKVWLYRIVTNTCFDYLKKKKVVAYSVDSLADSEGEEMKIEIPDNANNPEIVLENKLDREIINKSIEMLDNDARIIVVMREMHQMSYKEIANVLSISEGTVKSRLNRAREKLKTIISNKLVELSV